jgi:hypothetical protein
MKSIIEPVAQPRYWPDNSSQKAGNDMTMELAEFLRKTQATVRAQMQDGALYEELVYANIVMDHMAEIGMTFEPVQCHFEGKVGNAILRLSGYALSDDNDQLDICSSAYTAGSR